MNENTSIMLLLVGTFFISVLALFTFIWAFSKNLFGMETSAASVIFAEGEEGTVEDPAATANEVRRLQAASPGGTERTVPSRASGAEIGERQQLDESTRVASFVWLSSAIFWLIIGSIFGLTTSIKMHEPDLLGQIPWLSFGRIRPVHLNVVAYGWAAMAGVGMSTWMLPRLLKTPLVGSGYSVSGAMIWNLALYSGILSLLLGWTNGLEWLEFPWPVGTLFVLGGALAAVPLILTVIRRKVDHLYVTVWYCGAALFWFPFLYLVANMPYVHFGVEGAVMNWWYGHNVLGYFMTPMAIGTAYYFIPKVLGEKIHSYNISVIGFWTLALFYGQVGMHHLVGGPIPSWVITLSIVQSTMMLLPVLAFAINMSQTLKGHYGAVIHSPTLRFILFGSVCYVLSSTQGTTEAWRWMSTIVHFTHYTIGHAHLGLYGFVTMIFFGGIYFVMPRILNWEWPYPRLISVHFWLVAVGITIYVLSMSIGGVLQGLAMLDEHRPFMDSVRVTIPYLEGRSIGGGMMTLGHFVFALHFYMMVLRHGPKRSMAAVIGWQPVKGEAAGS